MDIKQIQFAYTSYPLVSTVIWLFAVGFAAILFKVGGRVVKGLAGFCQRLLPAFAVVLLGLLVNLFVAFVIQNVLQAVSTTLPALSATALRELGNDRVAIFAGRVSDENELTSKGDKAYVAYVGEGERWVPLSLLVENQGEVVSVSDLGYTALNWPRYRDSFGENSVRYLNPGQPVVAVGKTVEYTQQPFSDSNVDTSTGLDARVVYAGSHADFVTAAQRRSLWPRMMVGLNSFALGAIGLGVLLSLGRRLIQREKAD